MFDKVHSSILASNAQCRNAAAYWLTTNLPDITLFDSPELAGEAQQMACNLVTQICQYRSSQDEVSQDKADQMFCIVTGGETVVSMDSATAGRGGRSQELALSFACHMRKVGAAPANWAVLAGGTDGRDGPTDAAGGIVTSSQNFDLSAAINALHRHDSYHFLSTQNSLVKTGATGTKPCRSCFDRLVRMSLLLCQTDQRLPLCRFET